MTSINTRGFSVLKETFIFDHCKSYDICFVQEPQISDPNFYLSLSHRWSGRCFWSPAIGRQAGVITFISDRFNCQVISWRKDSNGRILSILLLCGNSKINVVNIYATTNLSERKAFSTVYMSFSSQLIFW